MLSVKKENRLLMTTLFVYFVGGVSSVLLGNLMPFLQATYDINYARAGLLLSLPSWGNLVSVLLAGYLPSYIGRRKTILATSIWMVFAFGVFFTGIGGVTMLPFACLMMGIARGGNTNFSNTMVSTLTGKRAVMGYSWLHGTFAAGAVLSPLALVACTRSNPDGWRTMTLLTCILCVVQVMVYAKMPLPQENITKSIKKVDKSFLKSRNYWINVAIMFFYVSAEYAIVNWMVTYFTDTGILGEALSQMMSSLLWAIIFVGRMIGASLVGKVSQKLILLIDGIGLVVCFLVVFFGTSKLLIVSGIILVGLFMSTIYTIALAMGSRNVKGNDLGVSTMIFTSSIGAIITPSLVGILAERAGIHAGMGVVVVVTCLLLVMILVSIIPKRQSD